MLIKYLYSENTYLICGEEMKVGNKYGIHRAIDPLGALPQSAKIISSNMKIYDNEILINVNYLNVDSASFRQIEQVSKGNIKEISKCILSIVEKRGKLQNPITGSGGMLLGNVEKIGPKLKDKIDIKEGDKIASLVSLTLTPLRIDKILEIRPDVERVKIQGKAILFESGIYAKLPEDLNETVALAVFDVAGAPAQVRKVVKEGDSVLILGATGKSGLLCSYEANKKVGSNGRIIGQARNQKGVELLKDTGFFDKIIIADVFKPLDVLNKIYQVNDKKEVDIAINCLSVPDTEMTTIIPVRQNGVVYFFSMATNFTKAALGAEGIGKDVTMIIGNGYSQGHAEIALNALRESSKLREIFETRYSIN